MKYQWTLIIGIIFTLIVAIFAVINVDPVTVEFGFASSELPLILVILGSVLMGGLIVGSVGLFRLFVTQRQVKKLELENARLQEEVTALQKGPVASRPSALDPVKDAPDSMGSAEGE